MADGSSKKRVLPARERREAAAKRRASPMQQPPVQRSRKQSTPLHSSEPRPKRKYTKRASKVKDDTPVPRSSASASDAEDALPTKVTANKPLPTLKEKQPTNLSHNEYQSVAESGTLAVSLSRSRLQWLCDGVFEKYWIKPVKRKGVVEAPPHNPDVKSMQKLGSATITIEPHTFDAIFYTVRDPAAPQPYQRHPNQHTAKNKIPPPPSYGMYHASGPYQQPRPHGIPPPPPPPPPTPGPPSSTTTAPPPAQPIPSSSASPSAPSRGPVPAGPLPQYTKPEDSRRQTSIAPIAPSSSPKEPAQSPHPNQTPDPPPPGGRGSTSEPVILMLAARAAGDPQVKELMKVVATSKASPEQLKEFQAHIDEFNDIIRRRENLTGDERLPSRPPSNPSGLPAQLEGSKEVKPESKPATPKPATLVQAPPPPSASPPAHQSTYNSTQVPPRQPPPSPGPGPLPGMMHTFPTPSHPAPGPGVPMGGYVGYPPPPRPEPIIKHIVLELTSAPSSSQSACQDRWLFPEHAVLEIRYGGLEMVCSFFVERSGSQILSKVGMDATDEENSRAHAKWKADQHYFQPVTMTVKAMNHRTIETIARAAKPLPAVQDYMKNVMGKSQRAPVEYLVQQLPRERGHVGVEGLETGFVDSGVELGSEPGTEDDELRDVYGI
ncbi:uncharacterized protein Z518_04665 [Rhinocladiella mackenziei CBS 650.93]|uniref:SWR1-complex protein 3 domain-containing protein n=1 Tax=Rhinocladiella mackenziei CBS 650.93 TaxID=1442369 RepID=A0A0D2ILP9_9EURO|nr:uncharacterized protein Z518_04665 [Rhinocladiella mackenziei CBS 650.93]KIX06689.1 hypothetical protein Z518_04665 [Rhinocladiella mackenziei CBS 650.93]